MCVCAPRGPASRGVAALCLGMCSVLRLQNIVKITAFVRISDKITFIHGLRAKEAAAPADRENGVPSFLKGTLMYIRFIKSRTRSMYLLYVCPKFWGAPHLLSSSLGERRRSACAAGRRGALVGRREGHQSSCDGIQAGTNSPSHSSMPNLQEWWSRYYFDTFPVFPGLTRIVLAPPLNEYC